METAQIHYFQPHLRKMANYQPRPSRLLERADLLQEGWLSLLSNQDLPASQALQRAAWAMRNAVRAQDPLTNQKRYWDRQRRQAADPEAWERAHPCPQAVEVPMQSMPPNAQPGQLFPWSQLLSHPDPLPDRALEQQELVGQVQAALTRLTPRQQRIIRLYFWEAQDQPQIAQILGCKESRVSDLFCQAVRRLKSLLFNWREEA